MSSNDLKERLPALPAKPEAANLSVPSGFVWAGFALLTILYYSIPLFGPQISIHWDLADVSYPVQKYFADAVRAGALPHWTAFLFSGMPFLSDPAVGAWYPLHWPFFLIGVTPRSLVWELALHAFLALGGAYLLARRFFDDVIPAALTGVLYAFNGFFAAHTTELGLFEAAALLPWLLWAASSAVSAATEAGAIEYYAVTALAAGLIVLTGHFGAAAYCGLALVLFVAASLAHTNRWTRAVLALSAAALGGFLLGAVVLLPWMEINHWTTRFSVDVPSATTAALHFKPLGTVMAADYFGLMSGNYKGPEGIRLYYFYGGLLAVPLALAGFLRKQKLWALGALIVPALWYGFGPVAGLARALAAIPAFRDAGAPALVWFVVALGVALAAASGAMWISEHAKRPRLAYVLLVLSISDLWFWNMYKNPLAFAHASYTELYGRHEASFESHLKEVKQGFYRIWAPEPIGSFGPLDGALIDRTESTWGAGLLELNRHAEYMRTIPSNPRLLNGLSITDLIDIGRGALAGNPAALGRVTSPSQVTFVAGAAEARSALLALDQDDAAVVEGPAHQLSSGTAVVAITGYQGGRYLVHYSAPGERLLRFSVPYAPGWRATLDGAKDGGTAPGQNLEVYPADYALCGVIVPGGDHDLEFRFLPSSFQWGAGLSVLGVLLVLAGLLFPASHLPRRVR